MSEQFAMEQDEFDSTNNRLDSILDRLNALGESAASMKEAPLRSLQSVPPLDPSVTVPEQPSEPVPAPNLGLVPPEAPAVPPLAPAAPASVIEVPSLPVTAAMPVSVELPTLPEVPVLPDTAAPMDVTIDVVAESPALAADPAPVSVEHYGLDLSAAPADAPATFDQVGSMEDAAVFELDSASLEAEAAIEAPEAAIEAPVSIFSLASSEVDVAPAEEEADGWVSYHDDGPAPESVEAPAPELVEEVEDPQWAIEPTEETSLFDDVIEPVVEESQDDLVTTLSQADDLVATADDEVATERVATGMNVDELDDLVTEETFKSDGELPLPDFTGVYHEGAGSADELPKSVESMGQVSARRDELDKLRPSEEDEPVALVKQSTDRSVMLQIVGVIFVGILAVLAVFLLDPAAVADMRESIEGLIG